MRKDLVSAGFVALDVIFDTAKAEIPRKVAAGGSACNVALIARFLGMGVSIVGEVGADRAGDLIRDELLRFGVDASRLVANPLFDTPVVIERLLEPAGGEPRHRFELKCPHCGNFFSRFRPSPIPRIENLAQGLAANAFVFDRATPATVKLAERFKAEGAFILFEPGSFGSGRPFRRALELSDAVKYSVDRLQGLVDSISPASIVIETRGSAGLNLYYPSRSGRSQKEFKAKYAGGAVDATGAGDWLTGGILASLRGRTTTTASALFSAVRFGQALAAMSTLFLGARGMMDALTRRQVLRGCEKVLAGEVPTVRRRPSGESAPPSIFGCYAGG